MFAHLKIGHKTIYVTPQDFLSACVEYFKWCEDTPLLEENIFQNKGMIIRANKAKVRAFTKSGLAQHLSIPASRLTSYKERGGDWAEVLELVEQAIYNQKFENAAAGLMNATIIARDLGLSEKQEFGGMKDAPPIAFNINPIASGTFLATATKAEQTE
jgi:hypothetical protein